MEPATSIEQPREPEGNAGGPSVPPQEKKPAGNGSPAPGAARKPPPQQRSRVSKAGDKRTKKGKRRMQTQVEPPPLERGDYATLVPVPRRSELLGPQPTGWRPVSLSSKEKAPLIELDKSSTVATAWKGYRMVRATHGTSKGTWYYEATMSHLGASGHVRLGWSTRKGELQAPVGYDECSYGYRDLEGSKVHKAWREDYGEPFQEGDVIGCYLHLGPGGRPFEKQISDIVMWKGGQYFEVHPNAEEPQPLPDSFVAFTKNGVWQGPAYRGLLEGTYYPAISIFTLPTQEEKATVTVNFGPNFKYTVPATDDWPAAQAVCLLAEDPPIQPEASGGVTKMDIDEQAAPFNEDQPNAATTTTPGVA